MGSERERGRESGGKREGGGENSYDRFMWHDVLKLYCCWL